MGNTPDVRVRLTAEGQLEIINAFKKIQAEADKTGRIGKRGLDALSGAASTLGRLLPGLTFAGAIAGATILAKRSLEAANNFAKLSQRTGVSVETLSAYAHAADLAGIDTETLANGLAKLAKSAAAAAKDTQDLTSPFHALGIAVKNQSGGLRSLDDLLGDVADRFATMEDGTRKAALAQELFGRGGAQLIPMLNQGRAGLEAMRLEAERLGLVFSTEAALAAEQFNDNMRRLRSTVDGFVNRELATLLPLLNELSEKLLLVATESDGAERLTTKLTIGFFGLGAAARFALKSLAAITTLGPAGLVVSATTFRKQLEGEFQAILQTIVDAQTKAAALTGKPKGPGGEPPVIDEGARTRALNAAKQLAEATLALQKTALENELALARAHNAAMTAEDAAHFKEGLTAVERYFAGRRQVLEQEGQKEIETLEEQAKLLTARVEAIRARPLAQKESPLAREAEALKALAELDKVATEAVVHRIKLQADGAVLNSEEREAVKKANADALRADAELAQAQGRRFEAARLQLEAEITGLHRLAGESDDAFRARQQALFDAGETGIQFDELEARARLIFADIESGRRAVESLVRRGILTELEGIKQIAAIEKERLPVIEGIAAAMAETAVTPEQIAAVRELNDATVQLAASADITGQRVAEFLSSFESALTADFFNFFTRGIDEAHSLGDAFRSLALSIVASLRQIVAQMLATIIVAQIMKAVFGLASAGAGAASGTITTGTGGGGDSPLAGATGGLVHGPGTSTSDSIPIRVSRGEYIIPAEVVQALGVDFFHEIRAMRQSIRPIGRVRGYAGGGLVEGSASRAAGFRGELDINEVLLMKRLSASPDFERFTLRVIEGNRRGIKRMLG